MLPEHLLGARHCVPWHSRATALSCSILILQCRKQETREGEKHAQDYIASIWQSQTQTQVCLKLSLNILTITQM